MTYPGSPGGRKAVDRWLASLAGGEPLVGHVAVAPVLTTESFTPGEDELHDLWGSGAWVSWWGGPAVKTGTDWPQAPDGRPLAHVATVHLGELAGVVHPTERRAWGEAMRSGLPEEGVLEVFLDLRHDDPVEPRGAVRWVPSPTTRLHAPPAGAQPDGTCCALWLTGFTVPSPSDCDERTTAAAQTAWRELDAAWSGGTGGAGRPGMTSFAYGHSRAGYGAVELDLDAALPLLDGDEHHLLLSLRPPLEGWLPAGTVLEVWARRSDLSDGRLEASWCVLRQVTSA